MLQQLLEVGICLSSISCFRCIFSGLSLYSLLKLSSKLLVLILYFIGTEGTPESVNPSVVDDEEGLPSPPLDEGAFFATNTTMELSQVCVSVCVCFLYSSLFP